MFGVGPWHIQSLCVNEMGMGYMPQQVGAMTLDMIFMLLADKKILRKSRKSRSTRGGMPSEDNDGFVRGRAKDGTPIKGRIRGKSLARQLMEEEKQKSETLEPGWKKRQRKREERKLRRNKK